MTFVEFLENSGRNLAFEGFIDDFNSPKCIDISKSAKENSGTSSSHSPSPATAIRKGLWLRFFWFGFKASVLLDRLERNLVVLVARLGAD